MFLASKASGRLRCAAAPGTSRLANRQSSDAQTGVGTSTEPSPDRDQSPSASTSSVTAVPIASGPALRRNDRDSCMNRPYTAHSPYSLSPTERIPSHGGRRRRDGRPTTASATANTRAPTSTTPGLRRDYEPIDRRWIWIAGVAGAILLVAVICTVVILGGGDSGSVSATVAPPATTNQPPPRRRRRPPPVGAPPHVAAAGNGDHRDADRERPAQRPADRCGPAHRAEHDHLPGDRQPASLDLVTVIYTERRERCRPMSTWHCRGRRRWCWTRV